MGSSFTPGAELTSLANCYHKPPSSKCKAYGLFAAFEAYLIEVAAFHTDFLARASSAADLAVRILIFK